MGEPNGKINQPLALELTSPLTLRLEPVQDLGPQQHPQQTPGSGLDAAQTLGPSSSTPPTPGPGGSEPAQLFLPLNDLIADDRRRDFFNKCAPLYKASMEGNWQTADRTLGDHESRHILIRCSITENCETMLHIAVSSEHPIFVQKLVDIMRKEDLGLQNLNGNTALGLAAITGNTQIASILVNNGNRDLLTMENKKQMIPLYIAALYGKHDMVSYLYDETNLQTWTDKDKRWVYLKCVEADLFDIALRIFQDHKEVAKLETQSVLGVLARKSSAFNETKQHIIQRYSVNSGRDVLQTNESEAMSLLREILTSIEEKPKKEIDVILRGRPDTLTHGRQLKYPSRVLFVAAEQGNIKFIVELIRKYHDLIWKINDDGLSIFHIAVLHRHESIYNLLYEIGSMKDSIVILKDQDGNNMLHLVGKMVGKKRLQEVSGAAFQMQLELLWYKEVESMVPPAYREKKNRYLQTPYELFTETHKELVIEGGKWMKGTASKCMVVSALIATIVFAVAYTIPGGYNQKDGFPMFLHNGPFLVFVILDAISLILSSTSILVFLSILTSRCAQEDFIESLPKTLMLGLLMLFLSIVAMMLSFSVSFFVLYRHMFIVVAIFISILALIPIISYARLQYPLFIDVYHSTYRSRYLFKPKKRMLYYQNPSA
ncbi:Ankyrin repeat-containing protein [Artemisia annua]|uniref:Ankyrin repeat-containing protein n=1 Tax=Artemisia annua TaxID=35608 RepID=A0A2U1P7C5_ARTAN|nr:Ankyrin repeat-containing protein [Artemisia annua]